jgi:DoxX-like family
MPPLKRFAIPILNWTVGLVLLTESCVFVFSPAAAHAFGKTHLPHWIRPAVGGLEIIAAAMFLIPPVAVAGGYALLVILGFAALIHLLHGWYDIGSLVISASAVLVCLAARSQAQTQS